MPADYETHHPLGRDSQSELVVVNSDQVPATLGWYPNAPASPEILSAGFDPIWLLHSLRRRWVLATGLGLVAALITGTLVWFVTPSKATATALLKVASVKPRIAFHIDEGGESDFDTYKRTQIALFKSHFVLQAALRRPGIAALPSIRDEADQIEWLRSNLEVLFPGDAEILRISMNGDDPAELVKFVDAASNAYLEEIVNKDRKQRLDMKDALTRSYHKTTEDIKRKTKEYADLALDESQDAKVDRSLAFNEMTLLRNEKDRIRRELLNEELQIKLLKTRRSDPMLLAAGVDELLEQDPQIMLLQQQLSQLDMLLVEEQRRAKRTDAPSLSRYQQQRAALEQQLIQRERELRPRLTFQLENTPDAKFKADLKSAELRHAFLTHRLAELEQEYADFTAHIKKLSERSLELDQLKEELNQLRKVASTMGSKIEAWEIELASPARVTPIQDATPTPGLNKLQRYILVGMGGFSGLSLVAFGIAFWDFQSRRLNGPRQIDEGLGLRVVGQLPSLTRQKNEELSKETVASLLESIDHVRTALMHVHSAKETRVVMVTSAAGHEGRTTVASQLAASLSRAGRKTLLIDGDLRHPSLHLTFDLPLEDGLCEVLRGEARLQDVIQHTVATNLSILTAGYCDLAAVQALGQDCIEPILTKLREDYHFVIIDSAPLLAVADSLIIGQHADGVLLSVLRDGSQVPRIHEASERLKSVGIRVLGVVVNGIKRREDRRINQMPVLSAAKTKNDSAEPQVAAT